MASQKKYAAEKVKYFSFTRHQNKQKEAQVDIMDAKKYKKSRNVDTLGPVELIVWPKQGNQGDQGDQGDQGEVSIEWFIRISKI